MSTSSNLKKSSSLASMSGSASVASIADVYGATGTWETEEAGEYASYLAYGWACPCEDTYPCWPGFAYPECTCCCTLYCLIPWGEEEDWEECIWPTLPRPGLRDNIGDRYDEDEEAV
ncbi:hypothetical protein BKA82DRAFT_7510 [Pisolithus tinctorius]|uniref:Uncharacterized protein n=1 Tax=Pisolithus tinctorius Marx 270 TaxID=870435 RepID=A0A0C3P9M6_PISTI|nr:hypothetical protein BKA82DRAFT_7510 [Pisolithus tinctorius]KIO10250.1 hypothetical protein M404DRAFT_7510 [Pisolithus tinctorius Marx 270]